MKIAKSALIALLAFATSAQLLAAGLDDYKTLQLPEAPRAQLGQGKVSVLFLGVTTLLFEDGETALMTDGYFTRPSNIQRVLVQPDPALISKTLARAGVQKLAAVMTVHSHFDHALDSPRVAQDTGALLVGSESTANIGRGQGLPESAIKVVKGGDSLSFGKFKVSFVKSAHLPAQFALGDITAPLKFPASVNDMKVGDALSILIEHESGGSYLIQGSAGYVPGALAGKKADVVFLGAGGLGAKDDAYVDAYWKENVQTVGAKRVIPVHWDNFYLPLDVALVPAPGFDKAMAVLLALGKRDGVEIRLQTEWRWVDPSAK